MTDLALSADGRSGWISLINPAQALSLHDGRWVPVAPPDPGGFYNLAISPNGRLGWAVGPSAAGYTLYRLAGQRWLAVAPVWLPPEPLLPERLATIRLTADDAGNGWLLANDAGDSGVGSGVPRLLLMRLRANQPPQPLTVTLPSAPGAVVSLEDLTVDNSGRGWLAGRTLQPIPPKTPYTLRPLVLLRVTGEVLTEVDPASTGAPPGLGSSNRLASNGDGTHTWLATSTSIFQFGALTELDEAWPHAAPAAAPPLAGAGQCFTRVPHCLRGVFARYWLAHGGLEQFGFPLTPEVWEAPAGKHLLVQYTERARLEYHPENRPPYDVQLGLLGNAVADIRAHEIPFQPAVAHGGPGFQWSPATQHNIGPPFLAYWQSHGGVPVFGLPRSEAFDEQSATDGKVYRVQYFERVRLEYHPENMGTRYEFLRGLLGVDWFKQTYGYTP
ncbi:MAG TPA: hypothetical protein VKY74_21820 [Chloroflexia bacterium]|nr:hypothetical protein [Chloroflexia bacterium]